MSRFFKRYRTAGRGFTLIELLVVCALMIIITVALLVRQGKFDSSTLLRSLAYSIALSITQAQIYGVSIFGNSSGTNTFPPDYGLYFSTASRSSYLLFADTYPASPNGQYDAGQDAVSQTFALTSGYSINEVCAIRTNGTTKDCSTAADTTGQNITNLTVMFRRPNPDACFTTDAFPTGCAPGATSNYSYAYITILGPDNTTIRTVGINAAGQITVCPLGATYPSTSC